MMNSEKLLKLWQFMPWDIVTARWKDAGIRSSSRVTMEDTSTLAMGKLLTLRQPPPWAQ